MDCYAPPRRYSHCACCAHRSRTRERPRRLLFVPLQMGVFVEEDDYETEPLYLHPHQYFPQDLQSRKSRKWSHRVIEEEKEEEMLKSPREFFHFEQNPRKKKIDARKNDYLQSLAHRLEALELGLERLTTVRNLPTPRHQRIRRGRAAGSPTPTDDFPEVEVVREKFIKRKRFAMNPEEAAVIIQSRFRAFLVRRSETLRHLRDLAMVKSTLKELHCLYADSRYKRFLCRDPDERNLFSERATALLLKVDSIQGCESMVREARRALSKELVTLLDSLDRMGAQCMERRRPPRVDKEDIMMRNSGDCIECSGEAPFPEADEEEMEESSDWRAPPSERRYFFPRSVCYNSNRGRHKHGRTHCRSSDFEAFACDNRKTRIPIKFGKRCCSHGDHEMTGIYDMDEVGFENYRSSAALPF